MQKKQIQQPHLNCLQERNEAMSPETSSTTNTGGRIFASPLAKKIAKDKGINLSQIKGKLPLLGVCFGAQFMAHNFGGKVAASNTREYGRANLSFVNSNDLFFEGVGEGSQVWMSHSDTIVDLPEHSELIASTHDVKNAAFKLTNEVSYGIQFHPEVYHTKDGLKILENFLVK